MTFCLSLSSINRISEMCYTSQSFCYISISGLFDCQIWEHSWKGIICSPNQSSIYIMLYCDVYVSSGPRFFCVFQIILQKLFIDQCHVRYDLYNISHFILYKPTNKLLVMLWVRVTTRKKASANQITCFVYSDLTFLGKIFGFKSYVKLYVASSTV